MPEQLFDAEMAEQKEQRQIEDSLQKLWEKARLVSDALLQCKKENKELRALLSSLELKERHSADELERRGREVEELRALLGHAQSNGNSLFSKEESEALRSRLTELIGRINSRL